MLIRTVLASVGCSLLLVTSTVSADAAGPIQLGKINYNSPGSDYATNASVNGEYVIIKNFGSSARSMTGWTLRDAANHVYKFGTFTLGAGKSVTVRTGKGTSTSATRYWGAGYHVWNNAGDKAYLRTASGAAIDYCAWTSNGPGYKSC